MAWLLVLFWSFIIPLVMAFFTGVKAGIVGGLIGAFVGAGVGIVNCWGVDHFGERVVSRMVTAEESTRLLDVIVAAIVIVGVLLWSIVIGFVSVYIIRMCS